MFANIVKLVINNAGSYDVISTSITDGPSGRKTTRTSADGKTILTIAHQDSNENPGFSTQRSTVRISKAKPSSDSDSVVTPYAQLTLSVPKDEVTVAEVAALVNELFAFVVFSENSGEDPAFAVADLTAIPRLYAGEP